MIGATHEKSNGQTEPARYAGPIGKCICKPPSPALADPTRCAKCGGRVPGSYARWKTVREQVTKLGTRTRVPLGLAALDTATRGGVPLAKLVVVGGGPGAGKTSLQAAQTSSLLARGVHTGFGCWDEDSDSVLIRLGQNIGLDRGALEDVEHRDHEASKEKLIAWSESVPLLHVDALAERASIEDIAIELRHRAGTEPAVLFVDSLQTLARRFEVADGGHADRRLTIDSVLDELRGLARRHDLVIEVTSELARGAYRSKVAAERTEPLASFKESGGIEYEADVALVMSSVKGVSNAFDVAIVKNRLGPRAEFRLRLDSETASFTECSSDDVVEAAMHEAAHDRKAQATRRRVIEAINSHPGLKSKNAVAAATSGRKENILGTIDILIAEGVVIKGERGFYVVDGKGGST